MPGTESFPSVVSTPPLRALSGVRRDADCAREPQAYACTRSTGWRHVVFGVDGLAAFPPCSTADRMRKMLASVVEAPELRARVVHTTAAAEKNRREKVRLVHQQHEQNERTRPRNITESQENARAHAIASGAIEADGEASTRLVRKTRRDATAGG